MKVTPLKKQSKKNQRKFHAAKRGSWNGVSPITRVVQSKRIYDRNLNELRFSNNFVEKRSSSFLKALRNQDFLSRTLLCIGLKSLKLQNEYFYDSA